MSRNVERSFQVLGALEPTDLRPEIDRRMGEPGMRPIPGGPSPWMRVAVVAIALAVFAAAAGLAWEAFEGIRREKLATPPDPWSWAPEGWTELPLPPEVRDEAAIVWTGKELVYWGGWPRGTGVDQAKADGFAFDPATRTWQPLPAAPIAGGGANATRDRLGGAKAVWTSSEVIFWDVETEDEATSATLALDPASGEWRRLDDALHRPEWGGAWAWTGRELIVFGGGRRDDPTTVQGAALNPATGAWLRIADAPVGMNLADAVWTGQEVIAVGSDSGQYLPEEDLWQGLGRLPLDHGECYVHGVAIEEAVFAWNCGIPDAWYPGFAWTNVDGGPPARQAEIDETYVGSYGRAVSAGSVVVVEQVDNIWVDKNLHIGSSDAPVHLWIWRPLTLPGLPPPTTAEDADYLVANFLVASTGYETYLPTLATQDVIDRCRDGVGGCAHLGGGGFSNWKSGDVAETTSGTFEVPVELRPEEGPNVSQVFVVGPGTAADGGDAELVVLDVRLG